MANFVSLEILRCATVSLSIKGDIKNKLVLQISLDYSYWIFYLVSLLEKQTEFNLPIF